MVAEVSPALATLTAAGWDCREPSEGGAIGPQLPQTIAPLIVGSAAAAAANRTTIQTIINGAYAAGGRTVTIGGFAGRVYLDETLVVSDNIELETQPGVELYSSSAGYRNLVRNGNAALSGTILRSRYGFLVCCATEDAVGTGTLEFAYTAGAPAANRVTTVRYKAPGDTAFGAATTLSTGGSNFLGKGVLTSGNGVSKLWFFCDPLGTGAFSPGLNPDNLTLTEQQAVTVQPLKGARPVTWSRTSGVVTVIEPGHKRAAGHRFELMTTATRGGQALFLGRIQYVVDDNTYTFLQAGGDVGATAGHVFANTNIRLTGRGKLNQDKFAKTSSYNDHNAFGVYFNGLNNFLIDGWAVDKCAAHAFHLTNVAHGQVRPASGYTFYDQVHFNGPANEVTVTGFASNSDDNIVGSGTTDYTCYLSHLPEEGSAVEDLLIDDVTVADGFEIRLYGANAANAGFKRVKLSNVRGNVSGTTAGEGNRVATALMTMLQDANCYLGGSGSKIDTLTVENFRVRPYPGVEKATMTFGFDGPNRAVLLDGIDLYSRPSGQGALVVQSNHEDIEVRAAVARDNPDGLLLFRCFMLALANTATLARLVMRSPKAVVTGATVYQGGTIYVAAGQTINELVIDDHELTDATGNLAVSVRVDGTVGNITFRGGRLSGLNTVVFISSTGVVGRIRLLGTNVAKPSGSNGYIVAGQGTLGALEMEGVTGSVHRIMDWGSVISQTTNLEVRNCFGLAQTAPPNLTGGGSWLAKLALYCDASVPFDPVATNVDNWVSKVRGTQFFNSNASFMYGQGMYVGNSTNWMRLETGWSRQPVASGSTLTSTYATSYEFEDMICDATAGAFTVTLKGNASVGQRQRVQNVGTANNVTVAAGTSNSFAAGSTAALTPGQVAIFECQKANVWSRIG